VESKSVDRSQGEVVITPREAINVWRQTVEMRQLPGSPERAVEVWLPELSALLTAYGFGRSDLLALTEANPEKWVEEEYLFQMRARNPPIAKNVAGTP